MSEETNNTSEVTSDQPIDQTTPSEDPAPTPTPDSTPVITDDNILQSVKACLGLMPDYTPFDAQIIMEINTVLGIVNQLGVGVHGYRISKEDNGSWLLFMAPELLEDNFIDEVKTYVAKRVQVLFDPPTSRILMEAMNKNIEELEWRICCHKETP